MHKCFISFKMEDKNKKEELEEVLGDSFINKSLKEPINSENLEYIMKKIREDYLSDSTVTIFLIGQKSNENLGEEEQIYIKRELQASLYNGSGNTRNGILGIVLPNMYNRIYKGEYYCNKCETTHNHVDINEKTEIKEFSYNYYLPNPENGCSWKPDDRYCVLVKWDDFNENPEKYIDLAFKKRSNTKLLDKIKVRP